MSLESAYRRASPNINGSLRFAELLADVGGINMYDHGLVKDARTLLRTALQTLEDLGHPTNTRVWGDIIIMLGLFTDIQGITQRAEGMNLRRRSVETRENWFGQIPVSQIDRDDEVLLHNAYADLACSFQQLNRFDDVTAYCEICLKQYRTWGAEEEYPYEYAKYYHHMAFVLVYQKDTGKAIDYAKRAADLMALGSPRSQIATVFRFDWAIILFQHGEKDRSIKEHKAILNKRINECGRFNLLTLQSRLTLGIMYFYKDDYVAAEYVPSPRT